MVPGSFRVALILVIATLIPGLPSASAQEVGAERPAEIRLGACAGAGDVVSPLASLIVPAGDVQGQAGAMPVEQSVTVVPVLLADLLGNAHMIVVYASPQESTAPVACGDIGGALSPDGTLAVGLGATNGSKLDGVAYFAPSPDGDGTIVTVLVADDGGGRTRPDSDAVAETGSADEAVAAVGASDTTGTNGADNQPSEDGARGARAGRDGVSSRGGDGGAG